MSHQRVVALHNACGKDFDSSVRKWCDLLQMQCKLTPTTNDVCIQDDEDKADVFDNDDSNEDSSNDDSDDHSEDDSDDDYIEGQTDDESIEGDSDEENTKGGSGNEDIEDEGGSDEQDSESDACSDNQEKHESNIFTSRTKGSSAHPEEGDAVVKVMELEDDERNYTTEETCTCSGNEDHSTDEETCTCSGDDICYEDDVECSIVSVGNKFAVQTTENLNSDNESCMETSDQHANAMNSLTFVHIAQSPEVLNEHQVDSEIRIQTGLGFKICGDNIDKMVNSRYMRLDRQNRSLHYFHSFAVQNRANFSGLEDACSSSIPHAEEIAKSIIPSLADDQKLKKNIAILISRVLVKHLKYFRLAFDDLIQWHIRHPFYKEMSAKSTVVSLCLLCLSRYFFLS